jgi:hypothetical protein
MDSVEYVIIFYILTENRGEEKWREENRSRGQREKRRN